MLTGGGNNLIANFLRRSELAFQQMMFPQLLSLVQSLTAFCHHMLYEYQPSPLLMETWTQDKVFNIEKETLVKTYDQLHQEILQATDHAKVDQTTHLKYLISSINATIFHQPKQAIDDLHKYFDYSMRQKITKGNQETNEYEFTSWAIKVNQPAMNLAGTSYRLGQYDQALLSVMETIKIAQSKNDSAQIL